MAEKGLMDNASHRSLLSRKSYASSKAGTQRRVIDYTTGVVDAIKEEDELAVIDRNGNSISLNPE